MLFTTVIFWKFFIIVSLLIFINSKILKSVFLQNFILLISSYLFYIYWDWRFLSLIIFVSAQTFISGFLINKFFERKFLFLTLSILANLIVLGVFKYFNFFASELSAVFGIELSNSLTSIILPVGLSFYIFQSLTYVIDIYNKKMKPEKRALHYFTYIAFFPQLVAGPIERASSLLPQFSRVKTLKFDNIFLGTKLVILGLFLKLIVADNLAPLVDFYFANYAQLKGGGLFLGALYFSIQIYGDFCGYSLIAIGVARIIGFSLMVNFQTPYFSTSIQEFWRRWHISLSTFFRDYVYIPLGGSKKGELNTSKNIFYTFTLSGLWHGANWTFIAWGFLHGVLLVIQRLFNYQRLFNCSVPKPIKTLFSWFFTMAFIMLLWIFFRSSSISDAVNYITIMVLNPDIPMLDGNLRGLIYCGYYLIVDLYLNRSKVYEHNKKISFREVIFLAMLLVLTIGTRSAGNINFIYFQF